MTPSRRLAFSFLGACGERLEWTITAPKDSRFLPDKAT